MPTPQQLLDQIHDTGYAALYNPALSSQERAAYLKLTKQKLRLVKQALRTKQKEIERRWDGRKAGEAQQEQRELAPYTLIDETLDRYEIACSALDIAIQLHQPLPEPLIVGKVFVSDTRLEDYAIVANQIEMKIWLLNNDIKLLSTKQFYFILPGVVFLVMAFLSWLTIWFKGQQSMLIMLLLVSAFFLICTLALIYADFVSRPRQLKKKQAALNTLQIKYKKARQARKQPTAV